MDYGVKGLVPPHPPSWGATSGRMTSWSAVPSEVKVATFIRTCWRTRAVLPSLLAGFAGHYAPRTLFPSIVHVRGDSTGAVLGQGRSDFLSWCRGRFPWSSVQKTINIHLLLLNTVIDVPVALVVQIPSVWQSLVRCSPVEYHTTDFPGSLLQEIFTYSDSLVRQWIHVGVNIDASGKITRFIREGGRSCSFSCRRGEDSRAPTVASLNSKLVVAPVVCNDRCRVVDDLAQSSTVVDVLCSC